MNDVSIKFKRKIMGIGRKNSFGITIPKEIQDFLQVKGGDFVEYLQLGKEIVIRKSSD